MNAFTTPSPLRSLPASRSPLRHLTIAALLLALVGATASLAQAQPAMPHGEHGARHAAHHRMGPGMAGGPMMGGHALDAVGASAEQKTQVRAIYQAARDDLRKQHDEGRALHRQMLALMAAPQIDAAAAEALRQQQLARHDAVSKRWLQAALEAHAVLTPEQRQKLAERMKTRLEMMERHQRERRSAQTPRS